MRFCLFIIGFFFTFNVFAQRYQTGDLLFQNLDCGELCDAIESVNEGYKGQKFSHIGLVYVKSDSVFIIEAIGNDVHLSTLAQFQSRTGKPLVQARLKSQYLQLIPNAIIFALMQLGKPYDDPFLINNGKYYCSELIYDAFAFANNGKPVFQLQAMTFMEPNTNIYFPAWIKYYKELNIEIPEGKPGINPGGISLSDKIEVIN